MTEAIPSVDDVLSIPAPRGRALEYPGKVFGYYLNVSPTARLVRATGVLGL